MISSIYIKDLAIIDELRIDLTKGLSVFIGETGAGKSIIVGAISFLCGQRADSGIIRTGADKAVIEGVFSVDERMRAILEEADIECDDEVIVYRTISSEGRSVIRVNDRTVTLNLLQRLLKDTVDIHSQKDSQYLLKSQNHRALLDVYAGHEDLLRQVKEGYEVLSDIQDRYEKFLSSNDSETDIDYYRYQIKEIDEAKLDKDEEEELLAFERRYKSYQKNIDHLSTAIDLYQREGGISESLYRVKKELDFLDEEVTAIAEKIDSSTLEIDEAFNGLKAILSSIDISEGQIDANQERLFTINRLKRKYRGDIDDILALREELAKRVSAYEDRQSIIDEYERDIAKAKETYDRAALTLHESRVSAAKKLKTDVIKEMEGLELKYFDFDVALKEGEAGPNGSDDISFMICTNKGEDLRPLAKVASGGEMSRILLGLKAIFVKMSSLGLVIFDEIDTGVSGKAALAVGKKMAKVAKDAQVLVITHLAQVAAFSDALYYVSKAERGERTTSDISLLDDEEKVRQLALMATATLTEPALAAATDLIAKAQAEKEDLWI